MSATDLDFLEPTPQEAPAKAPRRGAPRNCRAAVIGAGPYGLAAAAHLRAAGVETAVFGEPLSFWRRHMPSGMRMRSPWRATHISDPDDALSLDAYAGFIGLTPTEQMPIREFIRYGEWFQARAVPGLDARKVSRVEQAPRGFRLVLEDGDSIIAGHVVIAMGLINQWFRPVQFDRLPAALVSHSADHVDFAGFRGRAVTVLGRGQSAVESAVLLAEAGAEATLVSRGPVRWLVARSSGSGALQRARATLKSKSGVGRFPLDWLADAPGLLHQAPAGLRRGVTTQCLRPAASGWLMPRSGAVRFVAGRSIAAAKARGGRLALAFDDGASHETDHLLLATGYRVDIARLGVLDRSLLQRIATVDGSPILSAGFESSVGGLHFVGSNAVASFGPLMRFIAGAGFAARSLARSVLAAKR